MHDELILRFLRLLIKFVAYQGLYREGDLLVVVDYLDAFTREEVDQLILVSRPEDVGVGEFGELVDPCLAIVWRLWRHAMCFHQLLHQLVMLRSTSVPLQLQVWLKASFILHVIIGTGSPFKQYPFFVSKSNTTWQNKGTFLSSQCNHQS